MNSDIPDDPYAALGVPKDATSAAIKLAYRKLVLKFHPDKVTDDDLKQSAADKFHKIQTAWETVGDEDKRSRYDAQCRLSALRKEAAERQFAADPVRPDARSAASYRGPSDPRAAATFPSRGPERADKFHVEERRPYEAEYFDRPRATAERRDFDYDYDRPRRTPPREERQRSKVTRQDSKESERARHREKGRQATKATARNRDYKYSAPQPEIVSDTDSDLPTERGPRRAKDDDDLLRARDRYYEQTLRQEEEAAAGRYTDDRARKMFAAHNDAKSYIERSKGSRHYPAPAPDRRPSPPRLSSKDKVEYVRRDDGRPSVVRRSSARPRTASSRDEPEPTRRPRREAERRSSDEYDDPPRRPPPMNQTKSAPENIRIPTDKPRSYSAQLDLDRNDDFRPPPIRRAGTMPHQPSRRDESSKASKPSHLRQSEINEDYQRRSSVPDIAAAAPSPNKYQYGKEYADDHEYATPNGYRTEIREPNASSSRKVTRSPSPMRDHERARPAPARYPSHSQAMPPPPLRTTSTSYVYTPQGVEVMSPKIASPRSGMSRKESGRQDPYLFGEIPTSRSPRQAAGPFSPSAADNVKYREIRPEDIKFQTGYASSRRTSDARSPGYYRSNSYNNTPPVSA